MFATTPAPAPAQEYQSPAPQQGQPSKAPRKGKQQLHINTDLPPQLPPPADPTQTVQRPPPVETTIICNASPDRTSPRETAPETVSRRASRIGLRGIFGKGKGGRGGKHESQLESMTEDAEVASQVSSDSPFFAPPPKEPVKEKAAPAKLKSTKKERPARPVMTWDPPPLFQAFPQAVKSETLVAPVLPADIILRMHKERKAHEDRTVPGPQMVGDWHDYPSDDEVNGTKKTHKRQPSNFVECASKIYVLTTSGFMLQYASEGSPDRLPEKIMQLGKDSAAFASDAIPGKHWVLQVCQTTGEEGAVTAEARKSVFSKLGFGSNMKRPVANYLLVMKNAEEMDSWLGTMRREIQSLGGKTYRPDEAVRSTSQEAMQRLRERPSRRFLIESRSSQNSQVTSPVSPRVVSHRSSMAIAQSRMGRPSFASQHSGETLAQPSEIIHAGDLPRPLARRASSSALPSPSLAGPNVDKALPAQPALGSFSPIQLQSPVNALGIISTGRSDSWKTSPIDGVPRHSPPISKFSKHRSMMHMSAFSNRPVDEDRASQGPDSRKSSVGSADSSRAPNFSRPCFSQRHVHNKQLSDDRATSSGSTATSRVRTPSLTDGESTRPQSIAGDLPLSIRTLQRTIFQGHAEIAVAVSMSPGRAKQVETEIPEIIAPPIEDRPMIPKRYSSLEYANGHLPWNAAQEAASIVEVRSASCSPRPERLSSLQPGKKGRIGTPQLGPPSAPPTAALPPLPPSAKPSLTTPNSSVPSPASVNSPSKLRRPTSMHLKAESPRKIKPAASMSTLKLPKAPPMTIQERRMLHSKSHVLHGPPAMPPPTSALPPPPTAPPSGPLPPVPVVAQTQRPQTKPAQVPVSSGPAAPPTPPTRETPPSSIQPKFEQNSRLPESPLTHTEAPPVATKPQQQYLPESRRISVLGSPFIKNDVLRSPMSESWNKYLQRVGAS